MKVGSTHASGFRRGAQTKRGWSFRKRDRVEISYKLRVLRGRLYNGIRKRVNAAGAPFLYCLLFSGKLWSLVLAVGLLTHSALLGYPKQSKIRTSANALRIFGVAYCSCGKLLSVSGILSILWECGLFCLIAKDASKY